MGLAAVLQQFPSVPVQHDVCRIVTTRLIFNDESVGGAQATAAMGTAEAAAPVVWTSADFAAVLQKLGGSMDNELKMAQRTIFPSSQDSF